MNWGDGALEVFSFFIFIMMFVRLEMLPFISSTLKKITIPSRST